MDFLGVPAAHEGLGRGQPGSEIAGMLQAWFEQGSDGRFGLGVRGSSDLSMSMLDRFREADGSTYESEAE